MIVLGLGSNVGDRLKFLIESVRRLVSGPDAVIREPRVSPVYTSEAMLLEGSPPDWNMPFYNIALSGLTTLSPTELLLVVKRLEGEIGRQQRGKWAPREIDIDILWFDGVSLREEDLELPHPGLVERPFALLPCRDVLGKSPVSQSDLLQWIASAHYPVPTHQLPCGTRVSANSVQRQFLAGLQRYCAVESCISPVAEIVGILNATPDSFSDGGKWTNTDEAMTHIRSMITHGASVIDFGAESTRPGAAEVSAEEEVARLLPLLERYREEFPGGQGAALSIDTRKSEVLEHCLPFGIDFINDVSGLICSRMKNLVQESGARVVCMHNLGIPASKNLVLDAGLDPCREVLSWAEKKREELERLGVHPDQVVFDPGAGFGKSAEQSWQLLARIRELTGAGGSWYVGHSRKSFLSPLTASDFSDRDIETATISVELARKGVDYLRVHNVEANIRALRADVVLRSKGC